MNIIREKHDIWIHVEVLTNGYSPYTDDITIHIHDIRLQLLVDSMTQRLRCIVIRSFNHSSIPFAYNEFLFLPSIRPCAPSVYDIHNDRLHSGERLILNSVPSYGTADGDRYYNNTIIKRRRAYGVYFLRTYLDSAYVSNYMHLYDQVESGGATESSDSPASAPVTSMAIEQKDMQTKPLWKIHPCTQAGFVTFANILRLFGPASIAKNLEFILGQQLPSVAAPLDDGREKYPNTNVMALLRYNGISFLFPCMYHESGTYYIHTGSSAQAIIHYAEVVSNQDSVRDVKCDAATPTLPCLPIQHPLPSMVPLPAGDAYLQPIYILPSLLIRVHAAHLSLVLNKYNQIGSDTQQLIHTKIRQPIEQSRQWSVQDCLAYFGEPQGIFELPELTTLWLPMDSLPGVSTGTSNDGRKQDIVCNCNGETCNTGQTQTGLQMKDGIVVRRPYVYNYFLHGIDIVFDGMTHQILRMVLHTNLPNNQHFLLYHRANFYIGLPTPQNLTTVCNHAFNSTCDTSTQQSTQFVHCHQTVWDLEQVLGRGKRITKSDTVVESPPPYIQDTYKVQPNDHTSLIDTCVHLWSEYGLMVESCALSGCIVTVQVLL
uniref:UPF0183 protein C16orf70 n=1 Tax=Lygus hesperus TaxID=30085 RepID=A0A0A9WH29_LYGHE